MKRGAKRRGVGKPGGVRRSRRGGGVREEAPITPLRIPKGVETIVVFGGSFDPPHQFHINAWRLMQRLYGSRTWTLYVPAARNPLKEHAPAASDEERVFMIALEDWLRKNDEEQFSWAGVWTDEIDRARWYSNRGNSGPSFTIDTLRRLRSIAPPGVQLKVLIGSDQALSFHHWRDFKSILRLGELLVLLRAPTRTPRQFLDALDRSVWSLRDRLDWARRIVPTEPQEVSSTQLREALARQPADWTWWGPETDSIPGVVRIHIAEKALYGVGKSWTKARLAAHKRKLRKERTSESAFKWLLRDNRLNVGNYRILKNAAIEDLDKRRRAMKRRAKRAG